MLILSYLSSVKELFSNAAMEKGGNPILDVHESCRELLFSA
jgi:hypothetical protein